MSFVVNLLRAITVFLFFKGKGIFTGKNGITGKLRGASHDFKLAIPRNRKQGMLMFIPGT